MPRPRTWLVAACLLGSAPARADIPPPPSRPVDWNVPEPPVPDPPPEKPPLVPALAGFAALLVAVGGARRLFNAREASRCPSTT